MLEYLVEHVQEPVQGQDAEELVIEVAGDGFNEGERTVDQVGRVSVCG